MKSLHRLIAGAVLALLVGPLALVAPAHADEPLPGPETDPCGIVWRDREIAYWREAVVVQRETLLAREQAATGRALLAEDRAADLAADVTARTTERDRALLHVSRQSRAIARLQAKVAELRTRLRGGLVG